MTRIVNISRTDPFLSANSTVWPSDLEPPLDPSVYMIVIGLICGIGIPGNLLTFVVLWRVQQKTATIHLLLALAAADGLLVVFMFLNIPAPFFFLTLPPTVATVVEPMFAGAFFIVQMMSVWLVCYVCIERYVAICFPYRAVTFCTVGNAKRAVAVIFLASLILTSPLFIDSILVKANTIKQAGGAAFIDIYSSKIFPCLLFFIPCILLLFTNVRLAQGIRQAKRQHRKFADKQQRDNSHNITAALNIVAVVTSFLVTQLPNVGIFLWLWAVSVEITQAMTMSLTCIRFILIALNSSINILVYCLFYERFRRGMRQLFRCCTCCARLKPSSRRDMDGDNDSWRTGSVGMTRMSLLTNHIK